MLSFTSGKLIATMLRKGKEIGKIYVKDEEEEPEIESSVNIMELVRDLPDSVSKMKKEAIAKERLKKEIILDPKDKDVEIIPVFDSSPESHVYLSGSTGSGKTYTALQYCDADPAKRDICMFTKIDKKRLKDQAKLVTGKKKRLRFIDIHEFVKDFDNYDIEDFEGKILLFDDIDTFCDDLRIPIQHLRDQCFQTGKHYGILTIACTHTFKDYKRTMKMIDDSKYLVAFPSTNKAVAERLLKTDFLIPAKKRERILNASVRYCHHGMLWIHKYAPNYVICRRAVFIL